MFRKPSSATATDFWKCFRTNFEAMVCRSFLTFLFLYFNFKKVWCSYRLLIINAAFSRAGSRECLPIENIKLQQRYCSKSKHLWALALLKASLLSYVCLLVISPRFLVHLEAQVIFSDYLLFVVCL